MAVVFVFSSLMIIYTFVLYPITVFLLARFKTSQSKISAKSKPKGELPKITVIMVVYNESDKILAKLNNIFSSDYPSEKLSIIVASDGSNDNTVDLINSCGYRNVNCLAFKQRRGKAACLNDAVAHAKTDYLIMCDVRQMIASNAIASLISTLQSPDVGAVSGELTFTQEGENSYSKGIDAYWRYEKFVRQNESNINSTVGVTGALYAMKKSLYTSIPSGTILDDVLIPMNVVMQGKRVLFQQDAIAVDVPSNDPEREKNRKKRTLAGNFQLLALNKNILNPFKNPIFFQFISHKLFRLLSPYFMLLALLSNMLIVEQHGFFKITLIIQCSFYAFAIIGKLTPRLHNVSVFRVALAFVSLNWFAVLGLLEYLKSDKTYLW
ncbi:glycosyltransferase family 2 protein [Thalassotalea aquiviva]|uniref:glycosyltransferase family 2 protein n=1 Tax=Thalassotalea aquiviva TaxID=3242415 RepID=UPI00352AF546